jgi:hypothetical protein
MEVKIHNNISTTLSIIGAIFLILFISFDFFGVVTISLHFKLALYASLFVLMLWIFFNDDIFLSKLNIQNKYFSTGLYLLFYLLYVVNILIYKNHSLPYKRSTLFFVLLSIKICLIFLQINYSRKSAVNIILFNIFIISVLIINSVYYLYPSVVGVDPWDHYRIFKYMQENGVIKNFNNTYSKLPLYHIQAVTFSYISSTTYKHTINIMFSLSLVILSIVLTYLVSYRMTKMYKVSLLASLFCIISDQFIRMNFWMIPNSVGTVYAYLIIYMIVSKKKNVLIYLSMFLIVLTHTISASFLLIMLLVSTFYDYLYGMLYKNDQKPNYNMLIIYFIFMFFWWSYASGHIVYFSYLLKWSFKIDRYTPNLFFSFINGVTSYERLIQFIPEILYILLSLFGYLYMIKNINKPYYGIYSFMGLTIIGLSFFSPILKLNIRLERWRYLSQYLSCVPLAISFSLKIRGLFFKRYKILLIFFLSLLMFTSNVSNMDNSVVNKYVYRQATLKKSELSIISTLSRYADDVILSDKDYAFVMGMGFDVHATSVSPFLANETVDRMAGIFILRNKIVNEIFSLDKVMYKLEYDPHMMLNEKNIFMSNKEVLGYYLYE